MLKELSTRERQRSVSHSETFTKISQDTKYMAALMKVCILCVVFLFHFQEIWQECFINASRSSGFQFSFVVVVFCIFHITFCENYFFQSYVWLHSSNDKSNWKYKTKRQNIKIKWMGCHWKWCATQHPKYKSDIIILVCKLPFWWQMWLWKIVKNSMLNR